MQIGQLTTRVALQMGISQDTLSLWLSVCPPNLADSEYAAFVYQCARTGLDPLSRQIYLVARKGKGVVQTGIDGYRLIADRTGLYVGNDDPIYDEGLTQFEFLQTGRKNPSTATVSVYKLVSGHIGKFTATAEWNAYYPGEQQGYMWKKMGPLMLGKCSEALALRKAFPAELSGIYTTEEMMQAGIPDSDNSVDVELSKVANGEPLNKNASRVMERLDKLGISSDDEVVLRVLGGTPAVVPNTPQGTDKLKALWEILKRHESGEEWGMNLIGGSS